MRTMRFPLVLIIAVICLSGLPFSASGADNEVTRQSLRRVPGIYVSVERLDPEIRKHVLTEALLKKKVETRLRRAGIKVISKEEWYGLEGNPYLYINVHVLRTPAAQEYIYSVYIAFRQDVYPVREPIEIPGGTTWTTGGIVGLTYKPESIFASVKQQVDTFIAAYLSVNPK